MQGLGKEVHEGDGHPFTYGKPDLFLFLFNFFRRLMQVDDDRVEAIGSDALSDDHEPLEEVEHLNRQR